MGGRRCGALTPLLPLSPLSRRHSLPHLCGFASFVRGRTHTLDAETHKSSRNDRRSGRGGAAATAIGVLISAPLAYTANTGSHRYSGVPQRFRWLSRRTTGAQTRAGRDAAAQRGVAQRGAAVSTARCRTPAASPLTSLATPTALTALSADHSLRRLCGFASFVRGRAHTLDAETHRSRRNGGRSPAQPGGRDGAARGRDVHPAHRSRTPQTPGATAIAVYPSVFGVPGRRGSRAAGRGTRDATRRAEPGMEQRRRRVRRHGNAAATRAATRRKRSGNATSRIPKRKGCGSCVS